MTHQEELTQILKGKGIGPESSKSLKCEDIERVKFLFRQDDASIITKATLLTALLTLPPTDIEREFIDELNETPSIYLPVELLGFISETTDPYLSVIKRIIALHNLSYEEALDAIKHLFDDTPDYLKGSFLEAERLKRETFEENSAFLKVLKGQVTSVKIDTPILIDLGDCYDGCNRFTNLNLFLAPLLASLGYPCLVHSVDVVAPKEGITHHQVLKQAKKDPLKSINEIKTNLENPDIYWGHLDQEIYHKELFDLKKIRKEMVKRPFLATFEKMLQPFVASKNYLMTQYTHKHYKLEISKLVNEFCQFETALHVKGMEGTTMVNPKITSPCIRINNNTFEEIDISGIDFGFNFSLKRYDTYSPKESLEIGLRILRGEKLPERDFFIFQALIVLHFLLGMDKDEAIKKITHSIDNQIALSFWERF